MRYVKKQRPPRNLWTFLKSVKKTQDLFHFFFFSFLHSFLKTFLILTLSNHKTPLFLAALKF